MADALMDQFDELVPGAADKAALFLQIIKQQADKENVGLSFTPKEVKVDKRTKHMVLEATVVFGGTFTKGAPMKVIVFADPVGSSLQVGWQLTEQELGSVLGAFQANQDAHIRKQLKNMKPENQRKLSGMLKHFHGVVFMPVLSMLLDAVESASRPQGGSGFLGA